MQGRQRYKYVLFLQIKSAYLSRFISVIYRLFCTADLYGQLKNCVFAFLAVWFPAEPDLSEIEVEFVVRHIVPLIDHYQFNLMLLILH